MKNKLIEYTLRHLPVVNFLTANGNGIIAVTIGLFMLFGHA